MKWIVSILIFAFPVITLQDTANNSIDITSTGKLKVKMDNSSTKPAVTTHKVTRMVADSGASPSILKINTNGSINLK